VNTPQYFQKISTGISLAILAVGFSAIGLLSLIHGPFSGDSLDLSATSCTIGGFAGLTAGSIFFCAAFLYWRRYSWIAA
jgi:CBS domain containing-hemolysin-like protein